MTTTANIAAKGCSGTGITEELADALHGQLGRKVVAVVELVAEARTENRAGDEKVALSILTIEPAPTRETEDHLRNLARSFHYERKLTEDGPQLVTPGDGPEPTVKDVLAAGTAFEPHTYVDTKDAWCEICGLAAGEAVHQDQEQLSLDDPDTEEEPEPEEPGAA
jgi:hypothetical protein